MIMIGYNEVMSMNVDQCKIMLSYAMCLWCYASYASHMLCVHDASYANHYDKHWSIMTPW